MIKSSNPNGDLQTWSREYGNNMAMNWPVFEEYSEELKTIAKGSRASRLGKDHSDNNGVTMTSIRHKTDDGNDSNIDARSISNTGNDSANRYNFSCCFIYDTRPKLKSPPVLMLCYIKCISMGFIFFANLLFALSHDKNLF